MEMFDQAVLIRVVDANFATFSKELQKPVAASRSRDGSARLQGGMLVASGRSAEIPDQDIAGWGFQLETLGRGAKGRLGT